MTTPRHQASAAALELIKRFEGFSARSVRLADGRWMIGHGHTRTAREDVEITPADAEALLIYDLHAIAAAIDQAIFTPLTQNQVDALASFAFSIGAEAFRHSVVVRRINAGAMLEAASAIEIWRKADFEGERIVLDALVRRRAAEKALFLTPDGGFIPAPSPEIEPKPDDGLALTVAEGAPAEAEPLSPVERAAANLVARLQALAPVEPLEPEPAAPEPVVEPVSELAPFPDASIAEPLPEPVAQPEPAARAQSDIEAMRRRIFGIPEPRAKADASGFWPLALLGAAGMALFVGAVIWAFRAKPGGSGAVTAANIGVVVIGLIGILCVASAVYFLLERLSGRDL